LKWAESEACLRAVYENRRDEWARRMEILNQKAGTEIQADVLKQWKSRHRSHSRANRNYV
jgi:hypothetical protein